MRDADAAGEVENIKFTIAADKEADWWTPEWYSEFRVGHSWIKVEMADGTPDSYGFWPANLGHGGGFDPKAPWQDVAGEVHHPDTAHTPSAATSVEVSVAQLQQGIDYAQSKEHAEYNLLTFNCTTFAREMYKQVTGEDAPYAGLLIDDPNDLADTISRMNAARGLTPTEGATPDGGTAPDSKKAQDSSDVPDAE